MSIPSNADSSDPRTVARLVSLADQLEEAIRNERDVAATVAIHGIVRGLRRFFPDAFVIDDFSDVKPSAVSSLPVSRAPDPAAVSTAVKQFKEAMVAGEAATAITALQVIGLLKDIPSPAEELDRLEVELTRESGSYRLPFLPRVAKLALWFGDAEKAERYASEALSLILPPSGDPFDTSAEAIHDAHMVAGIVVLRRGDIQRAKEHLLASASTRGSQELKMLGPNLTLADELLKRGERDVVVQYLDQCRQFWKVGNHRLAAWIAQIRNGESPDFGPSLSI
ncbi:MAG: hypothetical protein WBC78_09830 [Candidatus Sulfotelmatobacter sp.]